MEKKCCCCKEPTGSIPILRIIDKLDSLFAKNDLAEAKRLLEYWEGEARALGDMRGLVEILSEQVGFYRSSGEKEKGLKAAEEAISILDEDDNSDSVANATIYLNCATTMKAFDEVKEAMPYYEKAKDIYERMLPEDDFRLAGFYNNYATALRDLDESREDEAKACYDKAIAILKKLGGFSEIAVTYVNMALQVFGKAQESGEDCDDEIDELLGLAYDSLDDESIERDTDYAHTCEKCATVFGFFGYFIQKQELEERAKKIYDSNR